MRLKLPSCAIEVTSMWDCGRQYVRLRLLVCRIEMIAILD